MSVAPGVRIDAPIRILLIGGANGARIVDLHTGDVTPFALSPNTMGAVAVPEGVVSISRGVTFVPFDGTDPVYLGPAQGVIAQDEQTVWLISYDPPDGIPSVSLVDISGRVLAGPHPLFSGRVAGADGAGLVLQAGGRVYRMRTDGVLSELGVADIMSVSSGGTLVVTCDERAECGYELWSPGESPVRLAAPDALKRAQQSGWVEVAPDGRRAAAAIYEESGPSLVWVDLVAGSATDLTDLVPPGSLAFNGLSSLVWLPGDLGLIAVQPTALTRIYENYGGGFVVEELLSDGADRAFVIPG